MVVACSPRRQLHSLECRLSTHRHYPSDSLPPNVADPVVHYGLVIRQ
ncbi:hypothetical protein I553_5974 [Mycobacterium xenopi 4042]|uniref:Uncharacterized protein n=1 Tax=Mycobacterium xenopi 4042 TaxID=1299334 RepID=X8BE20_MYCXE|nr:hypothetical protein I553_5974 [Mycobacterium xenopi 4042]EUA44353.1 hypothetical protein I552_4126 [Mycobacterium xenopi 3993]